MTSRVGEGAPALLRDALDLVPDLRRLRLRVLRLEQPADRRDVSPRAVACDPGLGLRRLGLRLRLVGLGLGLVRRVDGLVSLLLRLGRLLIGLLGLLRRL